MKYLSFIIIAFWSAWMLVSNGDLKPLDNSFLWIMGVVSIMYTVVNITIFSVKFYERRKS